MFFNKAKRVPFNMRDISNGATGRVRVSEIRSKRGMKKCLEENNRLTGKIIKKRIGIMILRNTERLFLDSCGAFEFSFFFPFRIFAARARRFSLHFRKGG